MYADDLSSDSKLYRRVKCVCGISFFQWNLQHIEDCNKNFAKEN